MASFCDHEKEPLDHGFGFFPVADMSKDIFLRWSAAAA
jgi:hypothetical protein